MPWASSALPDVRADTSSSPARWPCCTTALAPFSTQPLAFFSARVATSVGS